MDFVDSIAYNIRFYTLSCTTIQQDQTMRTAIADAVKADANAVRARFTNFGDLGFSFGSDTNVSDESDLEGLNVTYIGVGTCQSSILTDSLLYSCDHTQYSVNGTYYCGVYDDSDFTATSACCECGGGFVSIPTPAPVSAAASVPATANGDPHLQNILGQRFDLMVPGLHTLINIPRGVEDAMLRITADAQKMQAHAFCGDLYFKALNVTGQWLDQIGSGGIFFQAGDAQQS